MKHQKVIIIKTGYSEILDRDSSLRKSSLGDVLRTTPLLHLFKNDSVTWITDSSAFPLLERTEFIERLLPYDITTVLQVQAEEFDTLINLEKVPGICALSDSISAWRKYGFRFHRTTGAAEAYDRAFEVLAVSSDPYAKKENKRTAQDLLFEMVGAQWQGEEYVLGYQPQTSDEEWDIGLNIRIGQKWPTKAWPFWYWSKLEKLLTEDGFRVSRQDTQPEEILTNLQMYMDWIHSCKAIVSNDSLGLHLSIAMKKKVVGLFGPTPHAEVHFYGRGKAILPEPSQCCIPCFRGVCESKKFCMEDIPPERVYKEAKDLIGGL